jgi:hypothetical protein
MTVSHIHNELLPENRLVGINRKKKEERNGRGV